MRERERVRERERERLILRERERERQTYLEPVASAVGFRVEGLGFRV